MMFRSVAYGFVCQCGGLPPACGHGGGTVAICSSAICQLVGCGQARLAEKSLKTVLWVKLRLRPCVCLERAY